MCNSSCALHFQFVKTVQQNTLTNPIQDNLKLMEDVASPNQYLFFFHFHEVAEVKFWIRHRYLLS